MAKGSIAAFFLKHTARVVISRKLSFCIGSCSAFIVVVAVALSFTVLNQMPVVFLTLAENDNGEIDMMLTGNWAMGHDSLNYTEIQRVLSRTAVANAADV